MSPCLSCPLLSYLHFRTILCLSLTVLFSTTYLLHVPLCLSCPVLSNKLLPVRPVQYCLTCPPSCPSCPVVSYMSPFLSVLSNSILHVPLVHTTLHGPPCPSCPVLPYMFLPACLSCPQVSYIFVLPHCCYVQYFKI